MKKLKLFRQLKKRNNGGFTLVEVVISCALLGILVIGVLSFATPVMNMVSSGRKNARATMLAESIDSYIAGMLKNAKLVEVFQYTSIERAKDTGTAGLKSAAGSATDKGLNKIDAFMQANPGEYDVRCLGISWTEDTKRDGQRKLVLTNNTVDNGLDGSSYKLNITNVSKVFDDALYEGLFPVIRLENFGMIAGSASSSSSSTVASSSSGGSPSSTWASGYKICCDIYGDNKCYNVTSADERLKSRIAFRSSSFVKCLNMTEGASDIIVMPTDGNVQSTINGNKDKNFPSGVSGVPTGALKYTENSSEFYYPDTYIYYVVPKKSLSTPAAPPTPSTPTT